MNIPFTMAKDNESQTAGGAAEATGERKGSCLLLEIGTLRMLVPRNIVADVIRYSFLDLAADADTGLTTFEWRGQLVPCADSGELPGTEAVEPGEDAKMVIFYGLRNQQQLPFYGIIVTRGPQLLHVGDGDLEEVDAPQLHAAELMRVRLNGEDAFIPKVDSLENRLLEQLENSNKGSE